MARSAFNGGRRQLVQPALPLLPKAVKEPTKSKRDDGRPGANGAAVPKLESTSEPLLDPQICTPEPSKEPKEHETVALVIPPEFAAPVDGATSVEQGAFDQDLYVKSTNDELSTDAHVAKSDTQREQRPELLPFGSNTETDLVATAQVNNNFGLSTQPVTGDEELEAPPDTVSVQKLANDIIDSTGDPSDSVVSNVEAPSSAPKLPGHLTSNSVMRHIPKNSVTLSIVSEAANIPSNQASTNGDINVSPEYRSSCDVSSPAQDEIPKRDTTTPARQQIPTVLEHIRTLLFMPEWFDCEICVYLPQTTKPFIYRNAHSLILIRSERLRNILYPQRVSSYSYYVINLVPARLIDVNAFDAALRFLYDDNVLCAERLFPSQAVMDRNGRFGAFDYVMSYMVAGLELGLEPVTTRALDLVGRLLDWDLAEIAVKEAVSLRSFSTPVVSSHAPPEALAAAKSLLQHVFNLIILHLNVKRFKIDTSTSTVDLLPRFAQFENNKAIVNPALANMVFGSMPASASLSPATPHEDATEPILSSESIASVIMLNIDFEDLRLLVQGLENVHGDDALQVIHQVVDEREHRRMSIANNRPISDQNRRHKSGKDNILNYRECLVDGILTRERVGHYA